ncbi:hypothetical protein AGABI2DRAFT_115886 [Agaricus bisporus var. bisporus H97]|uniref:hypothetical protein n=1 Tax=Agaricus bisporus var. bisporus (strain H97 / ATCC MYA-4626 / FGSC 10389) TaxID=936046 RepID=UPI00029F6234|nr:hypothetical protein AGABI2DRAFT_115886 [Agaricus bisporus var. bisporus H97]EKV48832.1 hypothetical protein AGABI2DRAFT_115886 [Agaricus bisporus var. bisporus H97]
MYAGDHVIYRAIGGAGPGTETSTTSGMIVDIMTETQPAGDSGVSAHASEEEPRYLIKNDNTGKESAYKATNILEKVNPAV